MIIRLIITIYFYEIVILIVFLDFFLSLFAFIIPYLKRYMHQVLSLSGRLYLFFSGCRIIMREKINIRKDTPYLIVSNHQSIFDIFTLYTILYPLQFKWIIKRSLFFLPFFGMIIKIMDYINIDRNNKHQALASIRKAINYINNGISIVIFPEGTRSLTDTIQEFKSGSIVIATRTGVDILPIVLKNTLNIMNKRSFFVNPMPIKVSALRPVRTKGLNAKELKDLLPELRKMMLKEYNNL